MPIVYAVDLDCEPRRVFGNEQLRDGVTRWIRTMALRNTFHEKGITDESRMLFEEKSVDNEGQERKRQLSVADVRKESSALEKTAPACQNCPAALTATPYSCFQQLFLPISAKGEQWLVDQVQSGESRCAAVLLQGLQGDREEVSGRFENWRKAGFLERQQPVIKPWGDSDLSSDDIFRLMFMVGDWMPTHSLGMLLGLDALEMEDGRRGDDILEMIEAFEKDKSLDLPPIKFRLMPEENDDPTIKEITQFLYAAYIAFSLQCPMSIHL